MGNNHRSTRTGQKAIEARTKEAEALRLRLAHFSLEYIADKLGYSDPAGAHKAIKRALDRSVQEPADELRFMELKRYDEMLLGIWGRVLKGDLPAIDRATRILHQRATLMGLNAPTKINWTLVVRNVAEEFGLSPDETKELERDVMRHLAETSGAV